MTLWKYCYTGSASETVNFVEEIFNRIDEVLTRARKAFVDDLLETYNDVWRDDGDEVADGKGGWIIMTSPELNASEFAEKYTIDFMIVGNTESFHLSHDSSDLFLGHVVETGFLDGLSMTNVRSSLAG